MHINRLAQQILNAYGARRPAGAEGTPDVREHKPGDGGSGDGVRGDDVALSEGVRMLQRVQRYLATVPDVREERVNALRAQVRSGTYQVAIDQLALRLLQFAG